MLRYLHTIDLYKYIHRTRQLLLLLSLFLVFSNSALSQSDYYWVGNSGQWEDYGHIHWATTSNGTVFHTTKPTPLDNVYFDQYSFTLPNQTVVVSGASIDCHDMIWNNILTGSTFSCNATINIYGSLVLAPNMTLLNNSNTTIFQSDLQEVINSGGPQNPLKNVTFNGNGQWTLQNYLNVDNDITLDKGTLITASNTLKCSKFISVPPDTNNIRILDLGSSLFIIKSVNNPPYLSWNVSNTGGTIEVLSNGNSLIQFVGTNGLSTMHAGVGLNYDDVEFMGPGRLEIDFDTIRDSYFHGPGEIIGDTNILNDSWFYDYGMINGHDNIFHNVTMEKDGDIGNLSLTGRDVDRNHFNIVEIYHRGRVYGNYNVFIDMLFSTHGEDCCPLCMSCVYCGYYQDGELHGNNDTVYNHLVFKREGKIFGTNNYFNDGTFWCDGWIYQGSNDFYDLNLYRHYQECFGTISQYAYPVSIHRNVLTLQEDSTQHVINNFNLLGNFYCGHTLVQSTSPTVPAFLSSDSVLVEDYIELHNIQSSNPMNIPDTAIRSLDDGGNAFWVFDPLYDSLYPEQNIITPVTPCFGNCSGGVALEPAGGVPPYLYSIMIYDPTQGFLYWSGFQTDSSFSGLCSVTYPVRIVDYYGCLLGEQVPIPSPPQIHLIDTIIQSISCFGMNDGMITFIASGGTGPLTYSLDGGPFQVSNIFTGLLPGNHMLVIHDSVGCSANYGPFFVYEPLDLSITTGGGNFFILCHGDSTAIIIAIPSGGTPPYTFTYIGPIASANYLSDTLTTTQDTIYEHAGNYKVVVVDAHGCKDSTNTQRFEPPPIDIQVTTGSSNNCADTLHFFANAVATGGTSPFTFFSYQWYSSTGAFLAFGPNLSNIPPGTYKVKVTDANQCVDSVYTTIDILNDTLLSMHDKHCKNGAFDGDVCFQGVGGSGQFAYLWSFNGQTTPCIFYLDTGQYFVTITDMVYGCKVIDSVYINQPDSLLSVFMDSDSTSCSGVNDGTAWLLASGGTPPYSYQWSNGLGVNDTVFGLSAGTYYVTVTDSLGCKVIGTIIIYSPPPGSVSFQNGWHCTPQGYWALAIATGGTAPYTYSWTPNFSNTSQIEGPPGLYTVNVIDINGCSFNGSINLLPFDPGVTIHNVDCYNGSTGYATANASNGNPPYNYQWYLVGNPVPIDNDNLMQNQPAGNYYLSIVDSYNCQHLVFFTLTQPQAPLTIAVTSNSTLNFCYDDCNGFAVVQPTGGTFPYTYLWTPGNLTTSTVTDLCAGNYNLSITDYNGCLTTGNTIISSPPALVIDSVHTTPLLCNQPGFTGSATIYAHGGTGVLHYSMDGQPVVLTTLFTGLTAGTHYYSVRDDNFCIVNSTFVINQPPVLQVNFTGQGPTAFGGSDGWLLATAIGGTPGYTYNWSNGVNTPLNTGLPQGIYTVTVTDSHGCQIVVDTLLSSPGELLLSVSYQDILCNGFSTGSITASATGGVLPYTFQWNTGLPISGVITVSKTNLAPGIYSITVTDANNVTRNQTITLTQPAPWQTSLNFPDSICPGTNVGYAAVTVSGNTSPYSYSWNAGLGANTDSIYQLIPGNYIVTITDLNNCTTTTSLSIKAYYPPISQFSLNTVCLGNPTILINTSSVSNSILTQAGINWGDGTIATLNYPIPTLQHTYLTPGTYTVSLWVEDINACISSTTVHNAVVYSIPQAEFSYDTACFGQVTHLTDLSQDNGFPIVNQWWLIESNTINNQPVVNHVFSQFGNHIVKLYVENALNCMDSVIYTIPVDSLPFPAFTYVDSVCVPGMVRFIDQSLPNGSPLSTWNYNFGDGNSSTLVNPIHTYLLSGQTYPVTLTVTSQRGCSNQVIENVPVSPPFILQLHADSVCFGDPTQFNAIALSPPGDNILWQYWYFGDGNSTLAQNPQYTYSAPGTYTVVLTGTDEHGCTGTVFDSMIVVHPLPTPAFTYSVQCNQPIVTFTSTSLSGNTGGMTFVWNFGDASGPFTTTNPVTQHTYSGPGTYQVSLQVINDVLCERSITQPIIIEFPALPDFKADTACPGTIVNFQDLTTPIPVGWQWDFGDPSSGASNTSTLQNPGHIFSLPGYYNVTLTITNQNNCNYSVTKSIWVVTTPSALFSYNSTYSCQNDTVLFTDLSTTPTGVLNYWYWTFGDLNSGFSNHSLLQNPGHHFTEAGIFNVELIVSADGGHGCYDTVIQSVTVRPHPLAEYTSTISCKGDSTQFFDASQGINAVITSYFWDFGDGITTTVKNPWHIFTTAGTFQVSHVVWDEYGCSDTIVKIYTVLGPPLPAFTHSALCLNNPIQFNDNSNPVNGTATQWYWDFGDPASGFNNFSTLQNPTHNFGSPGNYTIRHGVVNSFGCRDTITMSIQVLATPLAGFTSVDTCLGLVTQFTDTSYSAAGFVTSWAWNFGDGQSSILQNPGHLYQTSGTHYATLSVIDNAQCYSSVTIPVTVFPLPNPMFTAQISCAESPVFFTNYSNGGGFLVTSWAWNFGDPTTTLDVSTLQNPNYTYASQGFYDVSLAMTNTEGCSNQVTQTIFVPAGAVADFSVDTLQACQNLPCMFHDQSFGLGSNIVSWFWDFNDGTTSTQINPSHTFLSPGMHQVTLTVTTLNGCTKTITKNIMINPLPSATFNYSGQCFSNPTSFFGLGNSPNLPITNWSWDFGDPISGINNASSIQNPTHTFTAPGTYTVRLTVTDSKHCPNTYITGITIYSVPLASFTFSQLTCHSDTVCFTDASNYNGTIPLGWQWQFGDPASGPANTSTLSGPCHVFTATASYNVTLTVTNTFGCQADTTMNILLLQGQLPTSNFTFTTECFGHPTTFTQTATPGGSPIASYNWNFGDPLSGASNNTTTFPNPQHTFSSAGTYNVSLTVVSQDLCSHTLTIPVIVKPTPFPGFTHNGDCQNTLILFQDTSITNGSPINSWSWTIDGISSGTASSISKVFSTSGNHNIILHLINQAGCDTTTVLSLLVYPSPIADFTMNPTSACKSETVSFSASASQPGFGQITSYQWNFGDGSPVLNSTTPFASHVYNTPANYNVRLIILNSHGCIDTIIHTLIVRPLPVPAITITSPTCVNDTVQFTSNSTLPNGGTIQTYNWNFGDPSSGLNNFSSQQNPKHVFTPAPGVYTVTLQVSDSYCSNQVQQVLTLHPLPLVNFSTDTACLGEQTHFTDLSSSPGSTINAWQWTLSPGSSLIQNPVTTYAVAGYHQVTLKVTNTNLCHAQTSKLVPVDSLPIPHFAYHDTCSPNVNAGQIIFDDQSIPNGCPIVGWHWVFTPGNTSASQNPLFTFNSINQTYAITLTVTSARGCTNSITQNVFVGPPLNINFTALPSCYLDSTYFIPEILEPATAIPNNWIWHFGDGNNGTSIPGNQAVHYYSNAGTYYVVLQQTLNNGCVDSIGKMINVHPLPQPDFTFDTTYCDAITQFTDLSTSTGSNIISWAWNFGDPLSGPNNISSLQNPTHQYPNQGGTYQVSLTVMTQDSCEKSITIEIIHGPCTHAEFSIVDTLTCTNIPVIFHDSSLVGGTSTILSRKWDFGDGSPVYTYIPFQDPVLHTYTQAGTYTVSLIILVTANNIQYSDTATHQITVYPTPVANFVTDSCCLGDTIRITNLTTLQSGIMSSWSWTFGDNTTSADQDPLTHFYQYAGTYNVSLYVISDHNCTSEKHRNVHVYPMPDAGFTAVPNFFCGIPDSVFFTNNSTIGGGVIAQNIYHLGYGQPIYAGPGNQMFLYNQFGTFTVGLTVVSDKGCRDSIYYPAMITIKQKPDPSFTYTPKPVTIMEPVVHFTDMTSSSGGHSCNWNFGDGTGWFSGDCSPIHIYADTGNYRVTLYVIDQNTCDSVYYDTIEIKGDMTAYVPNAFSPDGDNDNDYFGPIGTYLDPSDYLMTIYNRWGEEIYASTDLASPWDGRVRNSGDIAPVGVYVYYIRVKDLYNHRQEFRGTVLLLKKN